MLLRNIYLISLGSCCTATKHEDERAEPENNTRSSTEPFFDYIARKGQRDGSFI